MARELPVTGDGRAERPHLVEAGLAWPPDTFVRSKLLALARRGFRITVLASSGERIALDPGAEIDVVWMPSVREWLPGTILRTARDCLRLRLRHPASLARVRRASAELRGRSLRARLRWLRLFAALATLRPDVVHFEWETAALKFLPLLDLWQCPMVMSCHGGLELYSHAPSRSRTMAGVANAFGRAAAVHCVSDAMRAEAARHGLDPDKARVIRVGVDLDAFAPAQR